MLKESDIVYLAGPMSGLALFNYPAFYALAGMIKKEYNCRVLNPARQRNGLDYEEYMRLAFLDLDCANVIVFLNGWRNSVGAQMEFIRAVDIGGIRIILQSQIEADLHKRLIGELENWKIGELGKGKKTLTTDRHK